VHFLQIWIVPDRQGLQPGYAEKNFPETEKRGRLRLVVSGDGRDGSIPIHQDADLYAALLKQDETVVHRFAPDRKGWIQVARGEVTANDVPLAAGDGAALADEDRLSIRATADAEVLLFDLG
jgi:redox-sensitive bicupin YhaK (pirin superfamily)